MAANPQNAITASVIGTPDRTRVPVEKSSVPNDTRHGLAQLCTSTQVDDLARITADVIVIDAPPQDGRMMAAAMSVADLVVVPSSPSDADLDRALLTAEVAFNRGRSAVLLLTMAPQRDADTAEAREVLEAAEWPVLENSVRHLVAIRRSFGRAPLPEALAEYRPVVAEILDLMEGDQ